MKTHASKKQEDQVEEKSESRIHHPLDSTFAASNVPPPPPSENPSPSVAAQRKVQEAANSSPQVRQLMALQAGINQRLRAQQPVQLKSEPTLQAGTRLENKTGMPDQLKSGIENLSGLSMDDVKVHYNSDKPAQLQAHAYAQGTDIHLASGQEQHLAHEAWHVVQQKEGRVKPTLQLKGKANVNDEQGLEREADVMGAKALQAGSSPNEKSATSVEAGSLQRKQDPTIQRMVAVKNYRRVYVPDYQQPGTEAARTAFQDSVRALTGENDYNMVYADSGQFKAVLAEHLSDQSKEDLLYKNKYTDKATANALIGDATRRQSSPDAGPDQRKAIMDQLQDDLSGYENYVYARNTEVQEQFADPDELYLYDSDKLLEEYDVPEQFKLLHQADMQDTPGALPLNRIVNQSCVIQTLADMGADVKTMWDDQVSSTNVDAWHRACRTKNLDYRTDSQYIKILGKLNYNLVQNDSVRLNAMDWATLGDGEYFLSTGSGDIGHAIGVKVTDGEIETYYDQQNLHEETDNVIYTFKKP